MNLQDLKKKKPPELLAFAEEQGVEGAGERVVHGNACMRGRRFSAPGAASPARMS